MRGARSKCLEAERLETDNGKEGVVDKEGALGSNETVKQ